jgi:hypothetical protein
MAYLFIEGNEAKFCDRADLVAGAAATTSDFVQAIGDQID